MAALIDAAKQPDYPADIQLVISNRPEALGLRKADDMGVTAICIDHRDFKARADFEAELDAALRAHDIEFVACAGFMRVLGGAFVRAWSGKLINIHPSLLPKYKGLHTHKRAIEAKDVKHGCTVHWVSEGVDEGKIIAQSALEIDPANTPETLAKRVQDLEYDLYPAALKQVLSAVQTLPPSR
jgi:phosphoribosylglycinamide formyltransferase-1